MRALTQQPPSVSPNTGSQRPAPLFPSGHLKVFVLVTALFFLWGIPNNLNDVLIRQFMKSFAISRFQAGLVQSAFYLGYFLVAMPAALLMRKLGYKAGFVIGLLLFAFGTLLFWPAAIVGRYGFFLFALFVIASGLSFLETASNPFIAQLGDPASSERRLNFSQAFNPLGSITGVLVGTVFIFSGVELSPQQIEALKAQHLYDAYLRSETMRVIKPYLALSALAIFWALLILRAKFPTIQSEHEDGGDHGRFRELLPTHTSSWQCSRSSSMSVHKLGRGAISFSTCRSSLTNRKKLRDIFSLALLLRSALDGLSPLGLCASWPPLNCLALTRW